MAAWLNAVHQLVYFGGAHPIRLVGVVHDRDRAGVLLRNDETRCSVQCPRKTISVPGRCMSDRTGSPSSQSAGIIWATSFKVAAQSPSWLDAFLFWDAMIVASLIFFDFLIGEQGRGKIKDLVGWWWLLIEEKTYGGLAQKDAQAVLGFFEGCFSSKLISKRFFKQSAIWGLRIFLPVSALLYTVVAVQIAHEVQIEIEKGTDVILDLDEKFYVGVCLSFILAAILTCLMFAVSAMFTIILLRYMSKITSFFRITMAMVLDLAIGLGLGAIFIAVIFTLVRSIFVDLPSIFQLIEDALSRTYHLQAIALRRFVEMLDLPVLIVSLLPSLVHVLIAVSFVFSKLSRPLLQKPTALILVRLYESDKGVLTLLAAAIGVMAKLAQQGAKYIA